MKDSFKREYVERLDDAWRTEILEVIWMVGGTVGMWTERLALAVFQK